MKRLSILIFLLLQLFLQSQNAYKKNIFDDTFKHEAAGAIIAVATGEIVLQTTDLQGLSSAVGAAAGITITLGKEFIYDKFLMYGVFSISDIIAGCMGSITGAMIHRVIIDLHYRHEQKKIVKLQHAKELLD